MTNVFLRIEHDTAEPIVVSSLLGITPTSFAKRGDLPIGGKGPPYPWNVWALSSAWAVHSKDVGRHFEWLLSSIGSRSSELEDLRKRGFRLAIYCLWTSGGGYGGPVLSAEVIRGLANFAIDVYFDVGFLSNGKGPKKEVAE